LPGDGDDLLFGVFGVFGLLPLIIDIMNWRSSFVSGLYVLAFRVRERVRVRMLGLVSRLELGLRLGVGLRLGLVRSVLVRGPFEYY
jgi:hypothetical protein